MAREGDGHRPHADANRKGPFVAGWPYRPMKPLCFATILPALALMAPHHAQAQAAPDDAAADETALALQPSPDNAPATDEIVVTAPRYGEALILPETEFNEDEIGAYGSDSIGELIRNITPLIDGSGDEPIILVNGEPIGGTSEIGVYPPEVLARLAILPPEAAARYGYPPGRRVVNLVLKKNFSNWQAEAGTTIATAGGRRSDRASLGRFVIAGPTRWNAQLQYSRDSALLKSERTIAPRTGPVAPDGYVVGAGGGEIDPALSALAGEGVTSAAIPPGAALQPPTLGDFAATANKVGLEDPNRHETLLAPGRFIAFSAGVTRPLGKFSGSLNVNASSNRSTGLYGIPMASLILPAGSPWSPFADDVTLIRSFAGVRALRSEQDSKTLGASLLLSGAIGDWRASLAANYSRSWTDNLLERGIDGVAIQQMIDARDPAFNPYRPLPDTVLVSERNRGRSESMSARVNVAKPILKLPAGPVTTAITLGANRSRSANQRIDGLGELLARTARGRGQLSGQLSFGIPLASRSADVLQPLGDLSADLSIGSEKTSRTRVQSSIDGGLNWTPFPFLQLRGSYGYEEIVPSFDQLHAPRVATITRIYDLVREEVAEPVFVTGGNPGLGQGSRRSLSISGLLRPLGDQRLTLSIGYRSEVARGGATGFPALTPAIEALFPERITRDAAGRLVGVDARAVAIQRDSSARVTTGLVVRLPGRVIAAGGRAAVRKPGNPLQLSFSLSHRWQLRNELLIRRGAPVIDYLGPDGGQSRHSASFQFVAAKRGVGVELSGNWTGPARIRGPVLSGERRDYRYAPTALFDLSAFIEPEKIWARAKNAGWLSDLKLSIDVQNLLNGYRRVTFADGSIPDGYGRSEIDPLGRTLRVAVRKRF